MNALSADSLRKLALQARVAGRSNRFAAFTLLLEDAARQGHMQVTIDRYLSQDEMDDLKELGLTVKRESSQKEGSSWTTISWA